METYRALIPEDKAKWLKALRSGKYKQGIGRLKTSEGEFCCLGVFADGCRNADWSSSDAYGPLMNGVESALLPDQWIDCRAQEHLSADNDSGLPFTK